MPKEKPLKPTTVAKVNKIKRLKQPFVAELANAGVKNWKRVKAQADFDGFCEFMGLLYGDKAEQKIAVERSVKYFSVKLKIDKVEEVGKQFLQVSDGLAKAVAEDAGPKPEELQKRLAKLQDEFNASTGATDNQVAEIKLRFDQANMYINSNRPDLEKAVKVLEEAAQWISQIQPEDDLDSEPDDGEPLIDPKQLKKFMKMSKNRAHPFACGLATDGLAYTMNKPAKKPKALAKNVKTATGATKLCFGMATLEGKILVLDLDPQKKPLPGLLRKMKKWLKENKPLPANKVRLMQGGEEVPLSPDEFLEILADYEAIVPGVLSSGEGDTQRIRAVWAFVNEKAAAQDYAAARKGLATLDDLLDPVEETEEDSQGEPIPEAPPQQSPSEAGADLMVRLNGLTSRIKAFADAATLAGKLAGGNMEQKKAALAPRNELMNLVRDCKGMIGKNDEQAEALLVRIEEILNQAPEESPEDLKGPWQKKIDKYEGPVLTALSNLEGDTQKIRATWALVNETINGDEPDFGKVAKLLETLDKLLGAIADQKKWTAAHEETIDLYEEAMALNPENRTKLEAAWAMAVEKAEAMDFKTALVVVGKLKPALFDVINAGSGDESEEPLDIGGLWSKASSKWDKIIQNIVSDLNKLRPILADWQTEHGKDEQLAIIAQFELKDLLGDFEHTLDMTIRNMDGLIDANPKVRKVLAKNALLGVKDFRAHVNDSIKIQALDTIDFGVKFNVQKDLTSVLDDLKKPLRLMAA